MTTLRPAVAPASAPARPSARAALGAVLRRSTAARAVLLGLVGGFVAWIGVGIPSYWGDEAASVMSAERSLPGLFALLGNVDAVHGTYYLLLHLWIGVAGPSELATRTPSAAAVGLLVAGVVVLGERLGRIRLGIAAGAIAIVLPRDTYLATDARSYAFSAAAAVWVAVLFVRLLAGGRPRREWVLLGVAIGAASWLFLYTALLVPVLGVVVLVLRRDLLRRWLLSAAAAVVVALPIALLAIGERHQIAFLARRDVVSVGGVLVSQWFQEPAPAIGGWLLVVVGVALSLRRRRSTPAVVLGITWAVLPTAALLLGDLAVPVYTTRYLSFCAPAVALLMGLGVVRIAESVHGRGRRLALGGAALLAVTALAAPVYLAQRGPYGQANGADFQQAAEAAGDLGRPGDAVIFEEGTKPSIDPRLAYRLFPRDFAGLRDVELRTSFLDRAQLWDTVRPLSAVMPELGDEVIAVEQDPAGGALPADVDALRGAGYRVDATQHLHTETVYRLVRAGARTGS